MGVCLYFKIDFLSVQILLAMPRKGSRCCINTLVTLTDKGRGMIADDPCFLSKAVRAQLVEHLGGNTPLALIIQEMKNTPNPCGFSSIIIGIQFVERGIQYDPDEFAFPVFIYDAPYLPQACLKLNPLYEYYSVTYTGIS